MTEEELLTLSPGDRVKARDDLSPHSNDSFHRTIKGYGSVTQSMLQYAGQTLTVEQIATGWATGRPFIIAAETSQVGEDISCWYPHLIEFVADEPTTDPIPFTDEELKSLLSL